MLRSLAALLLFAFLAPVAGQARAEPLDAQLHAATQAMLDAVAPGDRSVWDAHLGRDFIRLDENGSVSTRAELLAEIEPLPAGLVGRMQIEDFRLTVDGGVAVATYEIQEDLNYHGQPIRSRFRSMDTWRRTRQGWRMLAQHTAAALKDPPQIALTQAQLCGYAGVDALTDAIRARVRCTPEGLAAERDGRPVVNYRGETPDVFFAPGQPRTRRIFLRGPNGEVDAFVDRAKAGT